MEQNFLTFQRIKNYLNVMFEQNTATFKMGNLLTLKMIIK